MDEKNMAAPQKGDLRLFFARKVWAAGGAAMREECALLKKPPAAECAAGGLRDWVARI
jgi:hypothetical protein